MAGRLSATDEKQVLCEPRACPSCIRKRIKCAPLGIRPCGNCVFRGIQKECLEDASERKLACVQCRVLKKTCDRLLPRCTRCVERGVPECVPFVPSSIASSSSSSSSSSPSKTRRKRKRSQPKLEEFSDSSSLRIDLARRKLARISPISDHSIHIVNPEVWEQVATVSMLSDFACDMSPMAIFDALCMPFNRLSFYFFSLCRFLHPRENLKLFRSMVDIVDYYFPDINTVVRLSLQTKLRLLMHNCESLLRLEAASIAIPLDSGSALVPAATRRIPNFTIDEIDVMNKFLAKFRTKWFERFPDKEPGDPSIALNKITPSGSFEFFLNKAAEDLLGCTLDEFHDHVSKREQRDREWKQRHSENQLNQLVTGTFW
eukprot:TRINITY_DN12684_c0_g1_i2.p1 TRINITY_DN12684_c0_g1~~TRINITY_DN12684_c0_g1_i2.p1  ORF type:complete len:406 (-),score=44.18 TRINITY_DN12684_c0_g1_i2:69-1187(-)